MNELNIYISEKLNWDYGLFNLNELDIIKYIIEFTVLNSLRLCNIKYCIIYLKSINEHSTYEIYFKC